MSARPAATRTPSARILDLVERESVADRDRSHGGRITDAEVRARARGDPRVHLSPALKDYIVRLVMATRDRRARRHAQLIAHPVSPRGTLSLAAAAKALAFLAGAITWRRTMSPSSPATPRPPPVLTWRAAAEGLTRAA